MAALVALCSTLWIFPRKDYVAAHPTPRPRRKGIGRKYDHTRDIVLTAGGRKDEFYSMLCSGDDSWFHDNADRCGRIEAKALFRFSAIVSKEKENLL